MRGSRKFAVALAAVVVGLAVGQASPAVGHEPTPAPAVLAGHCDISNVSLPVSLGYAVDDGRPVAGGMRTRATVRMTMPTLPLSVTVNQLVVHLVVPSTVGSVESVTFRGGNVRPSFAVDRSALVLTFAGPVPSDQLTLPTITIHERVVSGSPPVAPDWGTFTSIVASTNAGTARCLPGAIAPPEPLTPPTPNPDPFYEPPDGFERAAPGSVLRTRPVAAKVIALTVPVVATQALIRTTDSAGNPATTATTVLVPDVPTGGGGARPLVSYQVATDSLGALCQPSHTLRTVGEIETALIAPLLMAGDVVVVTDYEGPRHAYGAGVVEGQATLDGIRAALQLPGTGLDGARTPVAMWGYSGGAIATGWAAQLQPSYAPEINLVGAAMGGTPADLLATAQRMDGTVFSGFMLLVTIGLAREYPYFSLAFNDAGRALAKDLADVCLTTGILSVVGHGFHSLSQYLVVPDPLSDPLLAAVMQQVKMGGAAPHAPVYIYHAVYDEGIPYEAAVELRSSWCDKGADVTFVADTNTEHALLSVVGAPGAHTFLQDRLAGQPAHGGCGSPLPAPTPGPFTQLMMAIHAITGIKAR